MNPGFSPREARVLLNTRGIGPLVLQRLEQAGYCSLQQLQSAGADKVTEQVVRLMGTTAWTNRREALRRALERTCESA